MSANREGAETAWRQLYATVDQWFHAADHDVVRAVLACAMALELDQGAAWLLVVGPPASGKTELYIQCATGYPGRKVETSDISAAGLLSMERGREGEGILRRLEPRGLWLIRDFGSIQSLREQTRDLIIAALREVFDGRWQRTFAGKVSTFVGSVHLIGAATNSLERFHHLSNDLGPRFLYIRTQRATGPQLAGLVRAQRGKRALIRSQLTEASAALFSAAARQVTISQGAMDEISKWAELAARLRTPAHYDYRGEFVELGETESAGRLLGTLGAIAAGDASLHGASEVGPPQLALVKRIALDSAPLTRGLILHLLTSVPDMPPLRRTDLITALHVSHEAKLDRTRQELVAMGITIEHPDPPHLMVTLAPAIKALLWG